MRNLFCWCPLWQGGPIIGRNPTIWEGNKEEELVNWEKNY